MLDFDGRNGTTQGMANRRSPRRDGLPPALRATPELEHYRNHSLPKVVAIGAAVYSWRCGGQASRRFGGCCQAGGPTFQAITDSRTERAFAPRRLDSLVEGLAYVAVTGLPRKVVRDHIGY